MKRLLSFMFVLCFLGIARGQTLSFTPGSNNTVYVKKGGAGAKTGDSWANAAEELADVLQWAKNQSSQWETTPLQIWVAAGTYHPLYKEDGTKVLKDRSNRFAMVKNVKVYGGFAGTETSLENRNWGANPTILSGDFNEDDQVTGTATSTTAPLTITNNTENADCVVIARDVIDAVLDGFTIKGSYHTGDDYAGIKTLKSNLRLENLYVTLNTGKFGGGANIHTDSSPIIKNVTFEKNIATVAGGGLIVVNANPTLENVTITGNRQFGTTPAYGLIGGGGLTIWNSPNVSSTIKNSFINDNYAHEGGGVMNQNSKVLFKQTEFVGNVSSQHGGGIYNNSSGNAEFESVLIKGNRTLMWAGGGIFTKDNSNTKVTNSTLDFNVAKENGGAINNRNNSKTTLINVKVINNRAGGHYQTTGAPNSGYGGAIFNQGNSSTLCINCIVVNSKAQFGAAVMNLDNNTNTIFINSTIANNGAKDNGGYIYNNNPSAKIVFHNSLAMGNSIGIGGGVDRLEVKYSLIQGIENSDPSNGVLGFTATPPVTLFNIFLNTNINNYDATDFYKPRTVSFAGVSVLNAGSDALYTATETTEDIAGNPRISSTRIDMGAVEVPCSDIVTLPVVGVTTPTCDANGTASVTNYTSTVTYAVSGGLTVANDGTITGTITYGATYTLTATKDGCTSEEVSFVIAGRKTTPAKPIVAVTAPSCVANGTASITNIDVEAEYIVLDASNNTVTTASVSTVTGAITGIATNTEYKIVAKNASCSSGGQSSAPSDVFRILGQTPGPNQPQVSVVSATCASAGSAKVTNLEAGVTYVSNPSGLSVATDTGAISNFVFGTSYTLVAVNTACGGNSTSTVSTAFVIEARKVVPSTPIIRKEAATCSSAEVVKILGYVATATYEVVSGTTTVTVSITNEGVITGLNIGATYRIRVKGTDCDSQWTSNFSIADKKPTPNVPTLEITQATCSANGSAKVTNYQSGVTYVSTPAGLTVLASGTISGTITYGTAYTLKATQNGCDSGDSVTFVIEQQKIKPDAPIVDVVSATCSAPSTASVRYYDSALSYRSVPAGITVDSDGSIKGFEYGKEYVLIASNGTCDSPESTPFVILDTYETASITVDGEAFVNKAVVLKANVEGGEWTVSDGTMITYERRGSSIEVIAKQVGSVVFTYVTPGGCTSNYTLEVNDPRPTNKVKVAKGFSPNGDGVNDVWEIPYINLYPKNRVRIYDSWGNLVFQAKGYNNGSTVFKGEANVSKTGKLPEGTYFFIIEVGEANQYETTQGSLELRR